MAASLTTQQRLIIQTMLNIAGLYNGPINGLYTPDFGKAISDWQRRMGMAPTGVWDALTESNTASLVTFISGGEQSWSLDGGGLTYTESGALTGPYASISPSNSGGPPGPGGGDGPVTTPPEPEPEPVDPLAGDGYVNLLNYLRMLGLDTPSMIGFIEDALVGGMSPAEVRLAIQDQPDFKARFPQIEALRNNHMNVPDPAQIIAYENQVIEYLAQAGLSGLFGDFIPTFPTGATGSGGGGTGGGGTPRDIGAGDRYVGPQPEWARDPRTRQPRPGSGMAGDTHPGPYPGSGGTTEITPTPVGVPGYPTTSVAQTAAGNTTGNPYTAGIGSVPTSGGGSGGGGGGGGSGGSSGATPTSFQEWITELMLNGVSAADIGQRIMGGYAAVTNAPQEVREVFAEWFGPSGDAALAMFFLDPDQNLVDLLHIAQTATVGGMGAMVDIDITLGRADRIAGMGVSGLAAAQNFRSLDATRTLFQETLGEVNNMTVEGEGVDAAFGLAPGAQRLVELRRRSRMANFGGRPAALVGAEGAPGFGVSN